MILRDRPPSGLGPYCHIFLFYGAILREREIRMHETFLFSYNSYTKELSVWITVLDRLFVEVFLSRTNALWEA